MNKTLSTFMGVSALAVGLFTLPVEKASAAFSLSPNQEFSGGTAPSGSAPWATATFSQVNTTTVQLRMDLNLKDSDEFVSEWYFNLNPNYSPSGLTFSLIDRSSLAPSASNPTISTGVDSYKADGDGLYDILFSFDTAPPADRFGGTDYLIYNITRAAGLTEQDFNYLSAPAGSNGPFLTAAHVQGIGPNADLSGWIAPGTPVPEPLTLVGSGIALGFGTYLKRKMDKQKTKA